MLSDFEAYLLSKMRGVEYVTAALTRCDATVEQVRNQAQRATELWGFDRTDHMADSYRQAIGEPVSVRSLASDDVGPPFVGSVRSLYQLSLWPRVLFCVNRQPSGHAWGLKFVQRDWSSPVPDASLIQPWDWVDDFIQSSSLRVEVLDHWEYQKDLRVVFPQGQHHFAYLAKFDYGLLQEWSQVLD